QRMRREDRRLWRAGAVTAIIAMLTFAVPASSWGYWSASTALSATITTGTVGAPTGLTCTSSGILVFRQANVDWADVPGAVSYIVIVRNASGTVNQQTASPTSNIALT